MDQAPNLFRSFTLVLGIFSVIIGSHAHFKSQFTDVMKAENYKEECSSTFNKSCPSRSMELYFVSITIMATAISIAMFIALLIRSEPILDKVDAIFHLCAGLLVSIGGIVLIVSANQIWDIFNEQGAEKNSAQLYDQKIVAGILSLVNGICYIVVGLLTGVIIQKEMRMKNDHAIGFPNTKSPTALTPSAPPSHHHLN